MAPIPSLKIWWLFPACTSLSVYWQLLSLYIHGKPENQDHISLPIFLIYGHFFPLRLIIYTAHIITCDGSAGGWGRKRYGGIHLDVLIVNLTEIPSRNRGENKGCELSLSLHHPSDLAIALFTSLEPLSYLKDLRRCLKNPSTGGRLNLLYSPSYLTPKKLTNWRLLVWLKNSCMHNHCQTRP